MSLLGRAAPWRRRRWINSGSYTSPANPCLVISFTPEDNFLLEIFSLSDKNFPWSIFRNIGMRCDAYRWPGTKGRRTSRPEALGSLTSCTTKRPRDDVARECSGVVTISASGTRRALSWRAIANAGDAIWTGHRNWLGRGVQRWTPTPTHPQQPFFIHLSLAFGSFSPSAHGEHKAILRLPPEWHFLCVESNARYVAW